MSEKTKEQNPPTPPNADILTAFGIEKPYALWPIQESVYKVSCIQGDFCLKFVQYDKEKIDFLHDIMNYLLDQGFYRISRPIPTLSGDSAVKTAGGFYTLNRWVGGIACALDNDFHLLAAGRCLAAFSCAALGGELLPGGKAGYHEWPERFAQRTEDLITWQRQTAAKKHRNPFEKLYLKVAPEMIADGIEAQRLLAQSAYGYLADEALYYRAFVHRDVAARNFIIGPDGEGWLIDFDYCRYDLPLTDIVRFVERGMKAVVYTPQQLDRMLGAYETIRKIDSEEYRVISAMLLFPQKFWRLCSRYFAAPEDALKQGIYYKLINAMGQMKAHKDVWFYFHGKYGCR
ncbi:MAG: CotS family spore coat protein [Peptococcaceae bacterium]|jgi:CotS family spore coat protein|nr:CotS family spore coat protein [Peptococcaceae bacterium]